MEETILQELATVHLVFYKMTFQCKCNEKTNQKWTKNNESNQIIHRENGKRLNFSAFTHKWCKNIFNLTISMVYYTFQYRFVQKRKEINKQYIHKKNNMDWVDTCKDI